MHKKTAVWRKPRRVDAFGTLDVTVYQNPERQLSDSQVDAYTDIAQSAFTRAEPDRENVEEHVYADTLVEAKVDGEIIGFSGTEVLESEELEDDVVLGSGMAVDPEYQQQGIGSLIRTRGVLEDTESDGYFAARSANPGILSHMQDQYGAFPREGESTPYDVEIAMNEASQAIDDSKVFDAPVMESAYPEQMNDMPDHELSDFLREVMEEHGEGYDNGDALIMAAEVSEQDLIDEYELQVEESDFEVGTGI